MRLVKDRKQTKTLLIIHFAHFRLTFSSFLWVLNYNWPLFLHTLNDLMKGAKTSDHLNPHTHMSLSLVHLSYWITRGQLSHSLNTQYTQLFSFFAQINSIAKCASLVMSLAHLEFLEISFPSLYHHLFYFPFYSWIFNIKSIRLRSFAFACACNLWSSLIHFCQRIEINL